MSKERGQLSLRPVYRVKNWRRGYKNCALGDSNHSARAPKTLELRLLSLA